MDNQILNTCSAFFQYFPNLKSLIYYSHLVPAVLSLALGFFVSIRAKFNFLSRVFLGFVLVVCMWLVGDTIAWTSSNYNLVYTTWSLLVYVEILFYTLGLYFAIVFTNQKGASLSQRTLLFFGTLFPFFITTLSGSVVGFSHPTCEALNNEFLDLYKLIYEGVILSAILIYAISPFFQKTGRNFRETDMVVFGSMFLFLATFGVTEYLAATTGNYELNLYSLFLFPVFLVTIIYAVFELDIFNFKILGTHYLVVALVILMAGQLLFITDTANKLITLLAIVLAMALSVILFRNLKRESNQRTQIAKLNTDLGNLLKQRESLMHLINHKVKGSFTRSKYIFSGMLDGSFGNITPDLTKMAKAGLESDNAGIMTVDLVLNAFNMGEGKIQYDMKPVNFKELVEKVIEEKAGPAEAKGLKIEKEIGEGDFTTTGDPIWLKEVVNNLVGNSVVYTKEGIITVRLQKQDNKILLSVKDTGVGLTEEDKQKLFTEGGRGKDSVKINVDSTGYGLYSVKLILDAHKARVWAESEGAGKGSTFYVELPEA